MARSSQEQKQSAMKKGERFPYRSLMSHPAWHVVQQAISELESNGDLEFQTAEKYAVGYLVQQLIRAGLLPPTIPEDLAKADVPEHSWMVVYSKPVPVREYKPHHAKKRAG